MRKILDVSALLVLAALGCQSAPAAAPTTSEPATSQPPARKKVVTNMKTRLFEASSPNRIVVTPGTTMKRVTGSSGKAQSLALAMDNEGFLLDCGCPGGCTSGDGSGDLSLGCVMSNDDHVATCGGQCSAPDKSCFGCSFEVVRPTRSESAALFDEIEVLEEADPEPPGAEQPQGPAAPVPEVNER